MDSDEESRLFREAKEIQYGGKVEYLTYMKFLGIAGGGEKSIGGICFIINGTLFFEDFEQQNTIVGFLLGGKKSDWEKTEFSLPLSMIERIRFVSEQDALMCMRGHIDENSIAPVRGWTRFFIKRVLHVSLRENAPGFFIDPINANEFIRACFLGEEE